MTAGTPSSAGETPTLPESRLRCAQDDNIAQHLLGTAGLYNNGSLTLILCQPGRLTKTRASDLDVCLSPDLLEFRLRSFHFICILILQAQTLCEPEKRPAVVGQFLQVVAINLLRFGIAPIFHQSRP